MFNTEVYKALEERLGPVVGIAGGAAILLHALGYLSTRFHLRALGLQAEMELLSEAYIFEGAELLIFLLTLVPLLLAAGLVVALVIFLLRKIGPFRRAFAALGGHIRDLTPAHVAILGALWGAVTVHFFTRHILGFRDLVHGGIPCDPPWLLPVALSDGPTQAAFFLVLLLLPAPTLWVLGRLSTAPSWKPISVLIGLVALVQLILVPVHYGVLTSHSSLLHVQSQGPDGPQDSWQLSQTAKHVHLILRDQTTESGFRLRVIPVGEWKSFDIDSVDHLYEILSEGRTCVR